MTTPTSVAVALIGDVVRSKQHGDRRALQERVLAALDAVNRKIPALQPLEVTIGDEFQGVYRSIPLAVQASLLLRLRLLPESDTRYGLGLGSFTVFDADRHPQSQDGPAWWAAREAIEYVERLSHRRGRPKGTATWFIAHPSAAEGATGHLTGEDLQAVVNALLVCRDDLASRRVGANARLLEGWLSGATQQELANSEGTTQSAVSQRLSASGGAALRHADHLLSGAGTWL